MDTDNLVLELLRSMRADMARVKEDIVTLRAEMLATRQSVMGAVTLQQHDHADIAALKTRLDRVERRLALRE